MWSVQESISDKDFHEISEKGVTAEELQEIERKRAAEQALRRQRESDKSEKVPSKSDELDDDFEVEAAASTKSKRAAAGAGAKKKKKMTGTLDGFVVGSDEDEDEAPKKRGRKAGTKSKKEVGFVFAPSKALAWCDACRFAFGYLQVVRLSRGSGIEIVREPEPEMPGVHTHRSSLVSTVVHCVLRRGVAWCGVLRRAELGAVELVRESAVRRQETESVQSTPEPPRTHRTGTHLRRARGQSSTSSAFVESVLSWERAVHYVCRSLSLCSGAVASGKQEGSGGCEEGVRQKAGEGGGRRAGARRTRKSGDHR